MRIAVATVPEIETEEKTGGAFLEEGIAVAEKYGVNIGSNAGLLHYIETEDPAEMEALFAAAREVRERYYETDVYFRGLIEFTNYCKNDCYYCGIRRSNRRTERYRLTPDQILECCRMERFRFQDLCTPGWGRPLVHRRAYCGNPPGHTPGISGSRCHSFHRGAEPEKLRGLVVIHKV